MKRYSKPVYQGRRLRRMVELAEKSAEMPAREATSLPQAQRVDRRLSPETIAELVQAYRDGASTTELRRRYELSPGSVIKLLHEHSVAMPRTGRWRRCYCNRAIPERRNLWRSSANDSAPAGWHWGMLTKPRS